MPASCTHIYVHFIWTTWDRMTWITPELESAIHACIIHECESLHCQVIAVGSTEDHIHILARLHANIPVAVVAKQMKGASSHLVTHVLAPDEPFKWQGSYSAFSVSLSELDTVCAYVRDQKEHHASGNLRPELERLNEPTAKSGI